MTRRGIASGLIGVIAVSATSYFLARRSSIHRAVEAIARAGEYSTNDGPEWEPRYLEAEKAVADVMPGSPLTQANLEYCLSTVKVSHDLRQISFEAGYLMVKAKADGLGSNRIAESTDWAREARQKYLKQYEKSLKCVAELTGE